MEIKQAKDTRGIAIALHCDAIAVRLFVNDMMVWNGLDMGIGTRMDGYVHSKKHIRSHRIRSDRTMETIPQTYLDLVSLTFFFHHHYHVQKNNG
jgi:hypothetical protein